MTKLELKVTGAINPRKAVYIVRPTDEELLRLLERGEYCNVLCSRQMGKTSLLYRTKASLSVKGIKTALIDVAGYLGTPESANEWYVGLLQAIAGELELQVDVKEWWKTCNAATSNQRLIQFFREVVVVEKEVQYVIFLDEIDATLRLPYTDDFFVAIRSMYNDRVRETTYERISFCLVGVATPSELIKGSRTTPYNIGKTIELRDFDIVQDDLSALYLAVADDHALGQAMVLAVLRHTGGHPYLTLRVCDELVRKRIISPDQIDRLVSEHFPNVAALQSDTHFDHIRRLIDERVIDKPRALELYGRIWRGHPVLDQAAPMHTQLKLAGIVKRDEGGNLVVRNPIYRRVFNEEWAMAVIPAGIGALGDYKAVVASTFVDLEDHRAHVIGELRKAGFFVDPMEEWTSAAQEPKLLSTNRFDSVKLCVLLVARRRGHVPDGDTLSITQQEVAEAKRRGIDVLPFLLDDGVTEADWPWDDQEKPAVEAWRKDIGEHSVVSKFTKDPASIDLSPALTRWVKRTGAKVALDLYLKLVEHEYGTIQFLGLPHLKDNPNAPIHRLYVEPALAERQISTDMDTKWWPETQPVLDVMVKESKLVVLGDPGSGKSTLVSWIAWQLARHHHNGSSPWTERLGPLIPLPFILRNLGIGKGVTWDTLLRAFLDQPIAKLLDMADLQKILEEGRAIIMLDGLDEIGNPAVRCDLREAVWTAFEKYPKCRWILTSRIVAYDEVAFDIKRVARGRNRDHEEFREISLADLRYVSPFDDQRVEQFADNWFTLREDSEWKRQQMAREFVEAVRVHDSTKKLGRFPNLLTMMALIYRVRARLPHGRALLYDEIAQAYLETIDYQRKIFVRNESLAEKKRWLARVGFEMQRRRSTSEEEKRKRDKQEVGKEILATGDEVRWWIAAAMAESGKEGSEEDAAGFVDFLARRSGLLLPRGQDQFAFLHLSFQEYFAASFLMEQVLSPDWRDGGSEGIAAGAMSNDVGRYANDPVWRETLVFLVELMAVEQPRWLKTLRAGLFGVELAEISCPSPTPPAGDGSGANGTTAKNQNRVVLLARLVIDPQAGFDAIERDRAIRACCRWEMAAQKLTEGEPWNHSNTVAQTLLTADKGERLAITVMLAEAAQELEIIDLDLGGTGVTDLSPLAGLSGLTSLNLSGTGVSDLTPLVGLQNLSVVWLSKGQTVRIPEQLEKAICRS